MKTITIRALLIILSIAMGEFAFSQNYDPANGFHCEEDLEEYLIAGYSPSSSGGFFKPERTNNYPGTNSNSVFRILIIFVQFDNDTIDVNNSNWPSGSAPSYMNNLLATDRYNDFGSSWWDAYSESNAKLSDYWMELSRGNLHVTGEAHHLTLEHPWYWYNSNGGLAQINTEIYDSLDLKLDTRWREFDNWAYEEGTYKYQRDGKIDMMYVVYRTWRNVGVTPGSVATLYASNQGNEHVTESNDTIIAGLGQLGSGCTYTPGAPGGIASPFSADKFAPLQAHELGHYHFGWCHARYGIMAGGDCGFFTGLDSRHSPWETIKLGYGVAQLQTTSKTNYGLFDFSSRDNNDTLQVVQVPVSGSNEFFLMASRIKKSSYDRIMAGDTAHDNPFRDFNSGY